MICMQTKLMLKIIDMIIILKSNKILRNIIKFERILCLSKMEIESLISVILTNKEEDFNLNSLNILNFLKILKMLNILDKDFKGIILITNNKEVDSKNNKKKVIMNGL